MSKIKRMELTLNQKYALTEAEINAAIAESKKQGRSIPDLSKCRTTEELPTAGIMETLKSAFPRTEFYEVNKELRNMVVEYAGKKPRGIKDVLRPYLA